ncbi:MAG TPA: hypothetical protein VM364_02875 [Vicinamibacterales bacterium]|nr:hypothetical protein [Vicinamibacterales bacterium]
MKLASVAGLVATAWVLVQGTWMPQITGVPARLRGISAVSDRVAWASGTGGTVLRTVDGGRNWAAVGVPGAQQLDFRDVDAFNDKVAYVLSIGNGEASRIYKTTDAGRTWTLQLANTDPRVFLDAMAFWTPERGIAFSDSIDGEFVIFAVEDGRTWTRIPSDRLPRALPNEGAYAASGTNVAVHGDHVWIGTTASRVLHSPDRGRTWTVAQTPIPSSESAGIFSIAFRDALHGVAVGGDYKEESAAIDNVAWTSDGGGTWTLGRGLTGYRSAVAHVPRSKSWLAVGPRGADVSHDDGRTWSPFGDTGFHAFAFAPRSRIGWGVGDRGSIARLEKF